MQGRAQCTVNMQSRVDPDRRQYHYNNSRVCAEGWLVRQDTISAKQHFMCNISELQHTKNEKKKLNINGGGGGL